MAEEKTFLDIPGLSHLWAGLKQKLAKKDLSNVDAATGRSALGILNPDLNQNDPTAVDFVKNRTHWIEDLIVPYAQYAVDATYHRAIIEQGGLRDGENYTVTWEGTRYECTAIKQNVLYTVLGDDGVVPFKIQASSSRMYVYPTDTTLTAVNMGIKGPGAYHPMSENFLPVIPVSKGGTGATSVAAAQESLGIGGKRTTRLTVGTSTSGWAAKDCDYLCDGEADDVEINAAINALPEEGGEIVLLDGSYNLAADISIGKAGVAIRGNGQATKLIRAAEGADIFYIRYPGCTVENLYLDGQNIDGCGIYLGSNYNIIRGCIIKGNTSYGIQCWGAHNMISENTISTSYTGINILDEYNVVSNNVVLSNSEHGINVQGNHNIVTGNISRMNAVANLRLMSANHCTVVGNNCSVADGDEVTAQYAIQLYSTDNNNNIVTENLVGAGAATVDGGSNNIVGSNGNPSGVTPAQIGALESSKVVFGIDGYTTLADAINNMNHVSIATAYAWNPLSDFPIQEGGRWAIVIYNNDRAFTEIDATWADINNGSTRKWIGKYTQEVGNGIQWTELYSQNNKPTPADIGAMPSGFSGAIYADPNGGTTSFNLPDVTEKRNYLGIIRGLNPAYTAVYAFCGYQNSHYWAVPIKEHQYIGVSAQNGNSVTVTNNTGHNALYVRMIDMSIL